MRKNIFLIGLIFLILSCKETDLEKYKFIESIIKHPDSLEYIIKSSKYYSETYTSKWDMTVDHLESIKKQIKNCKIQNYKIIKDKYLKVFDSKLKKYELIHDIFIKGLFNFEDWTCNLCFVFIQKDGIWYLDFISTSDPGKPEL